MVESAADDYANILSAVDPSLETNPLNSTIDEMMARLEEYQQTLDRVHEASNGISTIIDFTEDFDALRGRIDDVDQMVDRIHANVEAAHRQVRIAEAELNVSDNSVADKLLRPLRAAAAAATTSGDAVADATDTNATNLNENGEFQRIPVFSSDDFFGPSSSVASAEEATNANSQ